MSARERLGLYPVIEPYRQERLKVGGGTSSISRSAATRRASRSLRARRARRRLQPDQRRFFDPARYRIVLFDQRGCGRARRTRSSRTTRPGTSSPTWSGCASTWASSAGRCSAARGASRSRSRTPRRHPERVSELVLRGIFLLRREEIDWFYQGGASWIFPDAWEDFLQADPGRPSAAT